MSRMSAIEKWFYGLAHLEDFHASQRRFPGHLRTETNSFKSVTTRTTTIASFDRAYDRAMGVKMVADELLAAAGAVLGGTAALVSNPGAFFLGVQSGEQAGRNLGSFMWSIIN